LIRPRVLLADDHPAFLEATTALLKRQFDVVGAAENGAKLVLEALRLRPDVIVTDITMPVMSGIVGQACVSDHPFRRAVR
jgi:DNA-binding NarL/FixJ family response regulator